LSDENKRGPMGKRSNRGVVAHPLPFTK
jgi:hypothetical protein